MTFVEVDGRFLDYADILRERVLLRRLLLEDIDELCLLLGCERTDEGTWYHEPSGSLILISVKQAKTFRTV